MADFKNLISDIQESYNLAKDSTDSGAYQKLSVILNNAKNQIRENIQNTTRDDINNIIKKLDRGNDIAPEELSLVKLWLVGDAEYYTKLENNFNDWLAELKRIIDELNNKGELPDVESSAGLIAEIGDAIRVVHDIIFFLENKERIKSFESSTGNLDKQEKEVLVRLLRNKLTSKEY